MLKSILTERSSSISIFRPFLFIFAFVVLCLMENLISPSSVSHHDEFFMNQTLVFAHSLKDLKNLKKQLYSAADCFETSYANNMDHQQIAMETVKEYTVKALVNTLDHLGSVAYKVNSFLDDKIGHASGAELRLSCMEQRLRTCHQFIDRRGRACQSLAPEFPMHHKRYILPDMEREVIGQPKDSQHQKNRAEDDLHQFQNAVEATSRELYRTTPVRNENLRFQSPQPCSRPRTFKFTDITSTKLQGKHDISLTRSCSVSHGKSNNLHCFGAKQRLSLTEPESRPPWRSISLYGGSSPGRARRDRNHKEIVPYSTCKTKGLLRSLLSSMRKPKKERYNLYTL